MEVQNYKSYAVAEEEYKAKNLIYYEHLLDSWVTTRLEHDKSLLFIAAGAAVLLITLITVINVPSIYYNMFSLFALISFLITAITITFTFDINAEYVKAILDENDKLIERKTKKLS